ncbi:MAG: GNAT family N-acetyltransferase [Rhodobacterales bacterium 34-62-10]|nr:MAG: GNAT family N-acetyltransferase [Rhodobacterales bacterium 34-62-10]
MPDIAITRTDTATKARIVGRLEGITEEAELTLSKLSARVVIADHTSVPDAMRGMGVGAALVERLIGDARASQQRIVPLCPFVRAQAQRNREEWADVIQW